MLVEEAMSGLVVVPGLEESRMEAIKARRTLAVDGDEGEEGLELGSGWFVLDDFLGEEVRHTATQVGSWECTPQPFLTLLLHRIAGAGTDRGSGEEGLQEDGEGRPHERNSRHEEGQGGG